MEVTPCPNCRTVSTIGLPEDQRRETARAWLAGIGEIDVSGEWREAFEGECQPVAAEENPS